MSTDSETLQTARVSYDPTRLAEASGFAEVAPPPRALGLEPLHLDLQDLDEEAEASRSFDTQPGLGAALPAPREAAAADPLRVSGSEGTLVLPLSALSEADKTLVLPAPPRPLEHTLVIAMPPTAVLQPPGAASEGGAATRIVPLEEWAPEAVASALAPRPEPAAKGAHEQRPGPLTALLRKFRALPMRQRVLAVLAPVTAFALLQSYLEPSPTARPAAPAVAATAARHAPVATPRAAVAATPAPSAPAAQTPVANVRAATGKTLQRAAADAVAEGNAAAALSLYRKLAAKEPQVPAYRAATRILEERVRGAEQ